MFARFPKVTEQVGCTEAVNVTSAANVTSANCTQAIKATYIALFTITPAVHLVLFQADKMQQM